MPFFEGKETCGAQTTPALARGNAQEVNGPPLGSAICPVRREPVPRGAAVDSGDAAVVDQKSPDVVPPLLMVFKKDSPEQEVR